MGSWGSWGDIRLRKVETCLRWTHFTTWKINCLLMWVCVWEETVSSNPFLKHICSRDTFLIYVYHQHDLFRHIKGKLIPYRGKKKVSPAELVKNTFSWKVFFLFQSLCHLKQIWTNTWPRLPDEIDFLPETCQHTILHLYLKSLGK